MTNEKSKLLGIQYLRAFAALMVVYYHLAGQVPAFAPYFHFDTVIDSAHLWSGVCVFFVISGFIMYVTGRKLTAGEFAWRRIARIVPLYWAVTLAVCALALVDPRLLHSTDLTIGNAVRSLLFLPYSNPTQGGMLFPILVPGWTLNYEVAFYALFAVALLFRWRMWIVGGVLCVGALLGVIHPQARMLSIWGFYTSTMLLLFAAGILLGAAYIKVKERPMSRRLPRWACALTMLAGLWLILGDLRPFALAQLIGSVAIVGGAVAWEHQYGLPRWKWLLLLGDASYSIYLVHLFAFGLTRTAWKHLHSGSALMFALFSAGTAIALALLTYRYIERPALKLLIRSPPVREIAAAPARLATLIADDRLGHVAHHAMELSDDRRIRSRALR